MPKSELSKENMGSPLASPRLPTESLGNLLETHGCVLLSGLVPVVEWFSKDTQQKHHQPWSGAPPTKKKRKKKTHPSGKNFHGTPGAFASHGANQKKHLHFGVVPPQNDPPIWVWVKIEPPGDRKFQSMFPFTRASHFGVTLFLTTTAIWKTSIGRTWCICVPRGWPQPRGRQDGGLPLLRAPEGVNDLRRRVHTRHAAAEQGFHHAVQQGLTRVSWGWFQFHYFQPSLFSKPADFSWGSDGFLERRIPGKNGEVFGRVFRTKKQAKQTNDKGSDAQWPGKK